MPKLIYKFKRLDEGDGTRLWEAYLDGVKVPTLQLNWNPDDPDISSEQRLMAIVMNNTITSMFRFMGSQATGGGVLSIEYEKDNNLSVSGNNNTMVIG